MEYFFLKIIAGTIAFGMGIDYPDVRNIHYGARGRAGQDGLPALATLITRKILNNEIINYINNVDTCRRENLFQSMEAYEHIGMGKCLCCDICETKCE